MFDWKRQCAVLIPCFNESGRIGPVVQAAGRYVSEVLVVDDGSTDATAQEAARAGATVISQAVNGGKGAALRVGWRRAHDAGFSWVLCVDGDGQHAASDIPKFFACAEQTAARLVIGNRMDQNAAMPLLRRWANRSMSRCLSNLTGHALPDSQCGFRLAHLPTLLKMPLASRGFVIESETLVAFLAARERIEFVPIQVIYGKGVSKIRLCRDTWNWMRWWTGQLPAT